MEEVEELQHPGRAAAVRRENLEVGENVVNENFENAGEGQGEEADNKNCLLYTSPSPRDA